MVNFKTILVQFWLQSHRYNWKPLYTVNSVICIVSGLVLIVLWLSWSPANGRPLVVSWTACIMGFVWIEAWIWFMGSESKRKGCGRWGQLHFQWWFCCPSFSYQGKLLASVHALVNRLPAGSFQTLDSSPTWTVQKCSLHKAGVRWLLTDRMLISLVYAYCQAFLLLSCV